MFIIATNEDLNNFLSKFRLKIVSASTDELTFLDTHCNKIEKKECYLVRSNNSFLLHKLDSTLLVKADDELNIKFFWDIKSKVLSQKLEKLKDSYLEEHQGSSSMIKAGLYYQIISENLRELKTMSSS